MAQMQTGWNIYSGISRTTINHGTNTVIEVFVPEFLPNQESDIPDTQILHASVTDPFTEAKCGPSVITKTEVVVCSYLGGTNTTVPCVHNGERVWVLNFDGTETYYWLPMGRDPGLRRHERMVWFTMDQPKSVTGKNEYKDVDLSDGDVDNTYYIEMNTNEGEKLLHLHTSINDGEPWTYDIRIYPEKGIMEFTDNAGKSSLNPGDDGNVIRLNTFEHWWHIRNTDDSRIDVNKENITLWCKDTITLEAGKHIVEKAGETYTRQAPTQTITGDTRTATFSKSETVKTPQGSYDVQTYALTYNNAAFGSGSATFSGKSFVVSTGTGQVPVLIICGSNSW